jgi:predicted TIM-barrel fold metal-dependent hydrolase
MGSDFPHTEGMAEPADFRKLIAELDESAQDDIMFHNAQQLISSGADGEVPPGPIAEDSCVRR